MAADPDTAPSGGGGNTLQTPLCFHCKETARMLQEIEPPLAQERNSYFFRMSDMWGRDERHDLAAPFGQQRHSSLEGVGIDPVLWRLMHSRSGYPVTPADVNVGYSL